MAEKSEKKIDSQKKETIAERQMNEGGIWPSHSSTEAMAKKPTNKKTE